MLTFSELQSRLDAPHAVRIETLKKFHIRNFSVFFNLTGVNRCVKLALKVIFNANFCKLVN